MLLIESDFFSSDWDMKLVERMVYIPRILCGNILVVSWVSGSMSPADIWLYNILRDTLQNAAWLLKA